MPPTTRSSSPSASAPASNSASDGHSVHAVAIKLPEFWADNARVWFAQTEAQFATKGITCSETKFYYCVAALGRADAAQVVDLIEPLTFALFRVSPPWSARQQCHLSYLSEFTSDLVHLPGLQNVVADALSWPF